MTEQSPGPSKAFTRYAAIFLGYMLLVILFGAWVRISGSGDGCGANWPDCHGEFIPQDLLSEHATLIEYTHRVTSGILGPMVLVLVYWAKKRFGVGPVFWASIVTLIFIIIESLIGAALVMGGLVADDDSVGRAVMISIHLVNTMALTGSAALVAWWSTGKPLPEWMHKSRLTMLMFIALGGLLLTNMTGAITALGDTLFPTDPTIGEGLFAAVRDDLSSANHFLVRLRIIHPVVAVITALYLMALTWVIRFRDVTQLVDRWAGFTLAFVIAQTLIGVINIMLAAPGWIQLVHLLFAQFVWIAVLFLTLATMTPEATRQSR